MFVLGIDPGLTRCGFGAVRRTKAGQEPVVHGVLTTPSTDDLPARLASMNRQMRAVIAEHRPDVVVVERVFFQTNARTAMGVGQASGLALVAAYDAGCVVVQYTSNEVKQGITGFGAADKAQVQRMVQRILGLADLPRPADAADALALALHHLAVAPFATLARSSIDGPTAGIGNARIASTLGGVRVTQSAATRKVGVAR
jgi:crossover junction endodeoxyribonuclease RuvC